MNRIDSIWNTAEENISELEKKIAVEDILKFRDKYTEKTNGTSATGCQYEAV